MKYYNKIEALDIGFNESMDPYKNPVKNYDPIYRQRLKLRETARLVQSPTANTWLSWDVIAGRCFQKAFNMVSGTKVACVIITVMLNP
jgi:hypothetical protein